MKGKRYGWEIMTLPLYLRSGSLWREICASKKNGGKYVPPKNGGKSKFSNNYSYIFKEEIIEERRRRGHGVMLT
jgi:hypothetical protein